VAFVMWAGGSFAAPAPCVGRFVVTRSTGALLAALEDVIAIDAESAVVDPACGGATIRGRATRRGWRVDARWPDCRGRRAVRLRARASEDCTLLRGRATAPGARASRFVASASRCGDGRLDPGRGERCDDGNLDDADGCDATCGRCIDPATLPSTWAGVQANVFDRACTNCHGAQPTAGLDFRAPGSYERIVGVDGGSGLVYLAPGERMQSLIWLKIAKATLGALDDLPGGGMPIGFPLPADVVEALGVWIDAGAPIEGFVAGAEALRPACP
jgi:cysteine-rich repeat protein